MTNGTVALLIVLHPRNLNNVSKHVIVLEKSTPGSTTPIQTLPEIPAAGATTSLSGKAAKEFEAQIGIILHETNLIDLTALAHSTPPVAEKLKKVKGSENVAPVILWERKEDQLELEKLKAQLTGLQEGKQAPMALKICDFEVLRENKGHDPAFLAALTMYEGLKKEDKI